MMLGVIEGDRPGRRPATR